MEAFEQFVAVALESESFIVSEAVKFPISRRTRKKAYEEWQVHGYEVDLVGARADSLVLATVKSFFGSRGVVFDEVAGKAALSRTAGYAILNDVDLREQIIMEAASTYGYSVDQVELRLYVGKFAAPKRGTHEAAIREWCAQQKAGRGPIAVFGADQVVGKVRAVARSRTYRDNAVLVSLKVLTAVGVLD